MTQRIENLIQQMKQGDIVPPITRIEYDPLDYSLPEAVRNAKRIIEFIMAQTVYITDDNRFTGMFRAQDWIALGDIFSRGGHPYFNELCKQYYNHYTDNLVVFEWQHTPPNYEKILNEGMASRLKDIAFYREKYQNEQDKVDFLNGMEIVCNGVVAWAHKCADTCEETAKTVSGTRQKELTALCKALRRVPEFPATSFYEGLVCLLFCFYFLPDGIGPMDRYLLDLYEKDIREKNITRDEAKELIQEVFVHLCAFTPLDCVNGDRSAECHFVVGGVTKDGEDGFTDFSRLIVESLMEMDTRRPEITLRWNDKTPFEVLRFMMDCERKDKNKRIAFANDGPRIRAFEKVIGLSHEDAVNYSVVGCNEPSVPGAVWFGGTTANIVRCLTNTLYKRTEEICAAKTYDEFYAVFREELRKDLEQILCYSDAFNEGRKQDINVLSCFLLDGCIESGKSATQFGCRVKVGGGEFMGTTCLIDSLSIIRQFVFEEKRTTMAHLIEVMQSNWEKDEELHRTILREGRFFGNNDPLSNEESRRLNREIYAYTKNRKLKCGCPVIFGTLNGYNPHNTRFGELTEATPDGRYRGEEFMIGTGQARGKDRNGLAALLQSVAQMDPTGVMCGPIVCNVLLDEKLIKDDAYFENVCRLFEQYFKMGGLHYQLNYVSKEDLLAARKNPTEYNNLKVRVSGWSGTFVKMDERLQNEIIHRTEKGN